MNGLSCLGTFHSYVDFIVALTVLEFEYWGLLNPNVELKYVNPPIMLKSNMGVVLCFTL